MAEEYADSCLTTNAYILSKEGFLAGYKVAQEHAHAALEEAEARMEEIKDQVAGVSKVMPQWISVKDRLPEEHKSVLGIVYDEIRLGYIELVSTDPGQFHWSGPDIYIDKGHYALTYWQELPEPPKEE
jgi:hypothetical protein